MRLFLDTEFNGFGGELISLAIVDEIGRSWYEVLPEPNPIKPWVAQNVIPVLDAHPISYNLFSVSLVYFLDAYPNKEIYADWPEDFVHLNRIIADVGSQKNYVLPFECDFHLIRGSPEIVSQRPHNALADARALAEWYLKHNP